MRSRKLLSLAWTLAWYLAAKPGAAQPNEILVRGGVIVTAEGRSEADLRVREGVIAEIGANLVGAAGARVIDARGLLVLPGGVDPHVHIGREDDYTTGSAAALAGGITTISNFIAPGEGESLRQALERESELVRAQTTADVMLHGLINRAEEQAAQVPSLVELGQTSLKIFMNRPAFDENSRSYLKVVDAAGKAGVLTMIHCEDDAILSRAVEVLMQEGRSSLRHYPESRPVLAEVIATRRAMAMAEATGSPLYVVHLSSEGALRVAEEAQAQGLSVYVETRPIYLHFTRERFKGETPGLYVGAPPLRERSDQDAIWQGIAGGSVHVLGTDHVPYTKAQKLDPSQTVANPRLGMSNLQEMRPLLYSEGVKKGRITEEQFVAVTATNPAKLFGVYPRKGTIAIGSDADLVLWDPEETRTIRDEDMLSRTGYSVYAGWEVTGWPRATIRRGEVVYENGRVQAEAGSGRLLRRERWQAP
jgi:dihydropyrimidinase